MLDGLRIMSKNIFGRAILAAFAGLIVVGFGFFGIRDVFTNFRANQLAKVGDAEIGVAQYRSEYQTALQRIQRQAKRAITNDEARQIGLDRQVLSQLLTGAALDQDAKRLGLALSDADIATTIKAEKMFAGPTGAFDQARMNEILRDNGYTETAYIREQRQTALRQQIAEAVTGGAENARRAPRCRQHLHQREPEGRLFRPAGARPLQGARPRRRRRAVLLRHAQGQLSHAGIPQGDGSRRRARRCRENAADLG